MYCSEHFQVPLGFCDGKTLSITVSRQRIHISKWDMNAFASRFTGLLRRALDWVTERQRHKLGENFPRCTGREWWEMVGWHMQDGVLAKAVPLCLRKQRVWSSSTQSWERPAGGLAHTWEDLSWLEKWDNRCFLKLNKDKCKILHLGQMFLAKASGCISALV